MNNDQSKGNTKDNGKVKQASSEMKDRNNPETRGKADQKSGKSQMHSGDIKRDSDRSKNANAQSSGRN